MINEDHRQLLDRLLQAIRDDPKTLPLREIADVRSAGLHVQVEKQSGTEIVLVSPQGDSRLRSLSPREREVAMLAASGYSNQQIATTLFVSLATVKDHMHSAFQKTGLSSRAQLIAAWYGGLAAESDLADGDS